MLRRLATLVLAIGVTFVGLTARPRAAACCIARQAPAHDCCKAPENLRTSSCCRGNQQLNHRAVNGQLQGQQYGAPTMHVALPIVGAIADIVSAACAEPLHRALGPPGSLTLQHTSLLL